MTVTSCSIAKNHSSDNYTGQGSGLTNNGTAHVGNSVITQNCPQNGFETGGSTAFVSDGYNFIGSQKADFGFGAQGSHDQVVGNTANDPKLSVLQDNGGPTPTLLPLNGSPLIDSGSSFGLTNDQRGLLRPIDDPALQNVGDSADIGAVEVDVVQSGPTFVVNTSDEHSDGFCGVQDCSFWDAMNAADGNPTNDTAITFAAGVTGTITTKLQSSGMNITRSMEVNGPGARVLAISGGGLGRIFNIAKDVQVTISGLELNNGVTPAAGSSGGAILNGGGDVTLNDCLLNGNSAADAGSQTHFGGGAIYNGSGTLRLNRCTLTNNNANGYGGAINNASTANVICTNCTFAGNNANDGAAVYSFGGNVTVNSSTIWNNAASASDGVGGINVAGGAATLTNSLIVTNLNTNGTITLSDLRGSDLQGDYDLLTTSSGFTFAAGQGAHNIFTSEPKVDSSGVKNNGGLTDTLALQSTSPAIDKADSNTAPANDQRGLARYGAPDIGAFELQPPPATPTPSVTPTPPSQLENLSTRKQVGTGDNVLIGGFIVAGTDDKKVLLRGLGPSLPVNGALSDPILELHDSTQGMVASNDNWHDAPNSADIAAILPPSSELESAILTTLSGKAAAQGGAGYTGVLAGAGGTTGIGLLEIYDLNTAANSKLANISTRGFVGSGDDLLIGGFIPGPGDRAPLKVLVRALGPSLTAQGVSGALKDPLLELHDANGIVVQNDNWKDADNASEIQATLPPPDDRECAIITTLRPLTSGYTAVVRGASGSTGVALVEVYALQ